MVHCAYGNRGGQRDQEEVTVGGTENVVKTASRLGISRLVHFSTAAVHEPDAVPRTITEDDPLDGGFAYAQMKIQAERVVVDSCPRLGTPFVVLRPTCVWGPFSPLWTLSIAELIRQGTPLVPADRSGVANVVYIDNLVKAVVRALQEDRALGEVFLINDDSPMDWSQLFGRLRGRPGCLLDPLGRCSRAARYPSERVSSWCCPKEYWRVKAGFGLDSLLQGSVECATARGATGREKLRNRIRSGKEGSVCPESLFQWQSQGALTLEAGNRVRQRVGSDVLVAMLSSGTAGKRILTAQGPRLTTPHLCIVFSGTRPNRVLSVKQSAHKAEGVEDQALRPLDPFFPAGWKGRLVPATLLDSCLAWIKAEVRQKETNALLAVANTPPVGLDMVSVHASYLEALETGFTEELSKCIGSELEQMPWYIQSIPPAAEDRSLQRGVVGDG